MAPLRRKRSGSFTPKNHWRHYAENLLAPLDRKRFGSIEVKNDTIQGRNQGKHDSFLVHGFSLLLSNSPSVWGAFIEHAIDFPFCFQPVLHGVTARKTALLGPKIRCFRDHVLALCRSNITFAAAIDLLIGFDNLIAALCSFLGHFDSSII